MFARIMAVVIACIVLLTLSFGALSAVTVRNQQINARLEALTKEAREIAFLAANNRLLRMGTDPAGPRPRRPPPLSTEPTGGDRPSHSQIWPRCFSKMKSKLTLKIEKKYL